MVSTIIVIFLAAAVILWNAPFSIRPLLRVMHRRWRRVLLVVLLSALGAAETHTSTPSKQAADLSNKKHWEPCKKGWRNGESPQALVPSTEMEMTRNQKDPAKRKNL